MCVDLVYTFRADILFMCLCDKKALEHTYTCAHMHTVCVPSRVNCWSILFIGSQSPGLLQITSNISKCYVKKTSKHKSYLQTKNGRVLHLAPCDLIRQLCIACHWGGGGGGGMGRRIVCIERKKWCWYVVMGWGGGGDIWKGSQRMGLWEPGEDCVCMGGGEDVMGI